MTESMHDNADERKCPQCGAELPKGVPAELCPKCLLACAMGPATETGGGTVLLPPGGSGQTSLVQPGQTFGHYRIVRSLGGGGMGTVFEAEDLENSRRVALKILSHRLDAPDARERFFREGRLAAAINHPNSVYIFGTEEVAGIPLISMELVQGGTLQDRVRTRGPMPPGEAVDAVLQIIDGLEAAQKAGVLHRDVKPSNCFVDPDGGVKVGDFGLSISTAVRTEPALTADGAFLGTPSFCPPEQLRGEELNVRSDIYAVGATLYYLLTGRTPFEAQNVVALIATVLERPAPSPRDARPEVSQGLAKVVQRCLQKDRSERFADYSELRRALAPFSSAAPTPASLPVRALAGIIDVLVLSFFSQAIMIMCFGSLMALVDVMSAPGLKGFAFICGSLGLTTLYYALLEGFYGATLGKAICKLRVSRPNRSLPGFSRALIRGLIWVWLPILPFWLSIGFFHEGGWRGFVQAPKMTAFYPVTNPSGYYVLIFSPYVVMALLFATARRRNGFAAIQDLASGTRVMVRHKSPVRSGTTVAVSEHLQVAGEAPAIGPYRVLQFLGASPDGTWMLGFDLRLMRKVWIRKVAPGAEPYPLALRNIGRPWRLRWLTGKRTPEENWDAFEAPSGQAFLRVIEKPQPWEQVRFWLWDLAREINASRRDHTEPQLLALNRVWITSDGTAKMLDFPVPGTESLQGASAGYAVNLANDFLGVVASSALHGRAEATPDPVRVPIAVHAKEFLRGLRQCAVDDALLVKLAPLLNRAATVSHLRRTLVVAGCAVFPLFAVTMMFLGGSFLQEFQKRQPDLLKLNQLLSQRRALKFIPQQNKPSQKDFSVYVGSRYASFITNSEAWNAPMTLAMIPGEAREFAENSITVAQQASPEEREHAEKLLKPMDTVMENARVDMRNSAFIGMVFHISLAMYVGVPAVIAALAFRGGLVLLIARVTYARRDGSRASRLRLLWRSLVAWSPVVLSLVLAGAGFGKKQPGLAVLGTVILIVAATISILLPRRGLQDWLAGTFPVVK